MGTMESSGSSVMPVSGATQGDHEGYKYLTTKVIGAVQDASYQETETYYIFDVYS